MMPYPVVQVAETILREAKSVGRALTPMQLIKLTYIAHGWSLAVTGRDLFEDRIEAWKYGPVIPALYQATKHFGGAEIPLNMVGDPNVTLLEAPDAALVKDVYKKYGHLSGVQLSALTHRAGSPWHQVYRDGVMNIEITDDIIRTHYTALLNDRRSAA
jgi:uncharacterized phage-associated protein